MRLLFSYIMIAMFKVLTMQEYTTEFYTNNTATVSVVVRTDDYLAANPFAGMANSVGRRLEPDLQLRIIHSYDLPRE